MTKDAGRRTATNRGAILADAELAGALLETEGEALFDPAFWESRSEMSAVGTGRGSAWFVGSGERRWVLRHYRRGGFMARISEDGYWWTGERRVRAFAEFRLLATLYERGVPVPRPVAARYRRAGWRYRCDLITRRVEDASPLSARLEEAPLERAAWLAIGAAVARMHAAGADHADLNAHNILVGAGGISIIDFDRGWLREPGSWTAKNLARLRRSLLKISAALPPGRFSPAEWNTLLEGYEFGGAPRGRGAPPDAAPRSARDRAASGQQANGTTSARQTDHTVRARPDDPPPGSR
jgi:3-deoxy-D-manno-octulosonic acid kinase